jgi:cytochrome c-type biogenesis protein CcmH/NrfG
MAFVIIWIFLLIVIGGILVNNLRHYKDVEKNVAEEIVIPDFGERDKAENTFVDKLRGLESLRKEGLISEEEFNRKRAEIMEQKW